MPRAAQAQIPSDLTLAIKQLHAAIRYQTKVARAELPAIWTLEQVREKFPAWSDDEIKRNFKFFARHPGGSPGRRWRATLDQVIAVQGAVEEGLVA